jgi:hypothetical protein
MVACTDQAEERGKDRARPPCGHPHATVGACSKNSTAQQAAPQQKIRARTDRITAANRDGEARAKIDDRAVI